MCKEFVLFSLLLVSLVQCECSGNSLCSEWTAHFNQTLANAHCYLLIFKLLGHAFDYLLYIPRPLTADCN